jgi:AraC-like DNA-binding protein
VFHILLTISQSVQMMALAPCIFVIIYLLLTRSKLTSVIIPVLYFTGLICGLLLPLLSAFTIITINPYVISLLKLGESFHTALSYLFIIQLIIGRAPGFLYYLILAVPLVGGSSYIYAAQISEEVCNLTNICLPTGNASSYYNIFSSCFTFMLVTFFVSRNYTDIGMDDARKKHKYWLIISLILLNLLLLSIELWQLWGEVSQMLYIFVQSTIKLGFIYIVLHSIFWVFTEAFYEKPAPVPVKRTVLLPAEEVMAKEIENLMEQERLYADLNFDRGMLAERLGIKEHQLSMIINLAFKKSFSSFVNTYRIEEAKRLLKAGNQPITIISYDVGFSSLTSFNRVFKEYTGLSPTEYRTAS